MISFKEWILESGYNLSGVPWYSNSDTPAIRGYDDGGGTQKLRMDSVKKKYNYLVGKRFKIKDGYLSTKFPIGSPGIITSVGGMNIGYKMDHEEIKRVFPTKNFLKYVE